MNDGDAYSVTTSPHDLDQVKQALADRNIKIRSAELTMLPKSQVSVDEKTAKQVLELVEYLEEHDDVQNVYANFDIPDSVMKEIG